VFLTGFCKETTSHDERIEIIAFSHHLKSRPDRTVFSSFLIQRTGKPLAHLSVKVLN
jgi:hypothetical protein